MTERPSSVAPYFRSSSRAGCAEELGVEALARGDDDFAGGIEPGTAEELGVVDLAEEPVGVLSAVVDEFVPGLGAEGNAIDEEQDAFGLGVFEQAVGLGDGGEGLPAPVAIWMRARGRFSAREVSRPVMTSIWHCRRPVWSSG